MERLLESKLSQGPLIEQTDARGHLAFVPVANATRMPQPKPRKWPGVKPMGHSQNAAPGTSAVGGPGLATVRRGIRVVEQQQSITGADMVRSWMGDDA